MKKLFAISIITSSLALSTAAFAATVPAEKEGDTGNTAAITQQADELIYTGVVQKHENGTALFTENKIYPLLGGNFQDNIGRAVNVIGKVVTEDDVKKIVVSKLEPAR